MQSHYYFGAVHCVSLLKGNLHSCIVLWLSSRMCNFGSKLSCNCRCSEIVENGCPRLEAHGAAWSVICSFLLWLLANAIDALTLFFSPRKMKRCTEFIYTNVFICVCVLLIGRREEQKKRHFGSVCHSFSIKLPISRRFMTQVTVQQQLYIVAFYVFDSHSISAKKQSSSLFI